jgi:MSHA biogenesis protein MshJ
MSLGGTQRYLAAVYHRYQAFSLRERALVALTLLAVTWGAWGATLGGYLDSSQAQLDGAVTAANQRIEGAVTERSRLQSAKASDPNALLIKERARLAAELAELGQSLGSLLDRFVDPNRMPALLEDVIRHHRGLTLTRIESLPAEPIDVSGPVRDGEKPSPVWIYRHPLRLELEGGYFDVLAYLAELEAGPWEFGWRHLSYQVRTHPVATVTLEIETLSREKSWIGV